MKKLISAAIVEQCYRDGLKEIYVETKNTIVTQEAKDLAQKYRIKFINHGVSVAKPEIGNINQKDVACTITEKVLAQLGDTKYDSETVSKIVKEVLNETTSKACPVPAKNFECIKDSKGLTVIKGNTVKLNRFEDAGKNKNVLLTDIITHHDGSPMSAGMMVWEKKDSFPWKLNYDEIDYIIEGELQITINGKDYNGKTGDVFYIPKGSEIVFGTPNRVKIMYVTYPANWSE